MSSSVIPASSKFAFRANVRRYSSSKGEAITDPKKDIIRRALYPSNIRNRSTPTGTWRPDVARALQRAIPSVQAHHTIDRAWLLHQRHVRKKRDAELARKFECMRKAMAELEKIDSRLYAEANKQDDPRARSDTELKVVKSLKGSELKALESRIAGLFPRELRLPTDTPSRNGWNYEWKPLSRSA
jgi:large subunit ribosomal protein L40